MNKKNIPCTHLIWVDMEMSGLSPSTDRILEIAIIVTDTKLNEVQQGEWVIKQKDAILLGMDSWNKKTHGDIQSLAIQKKIDLWGKTKPDERQNLDMPLVVRVKHSRLNIKEAERQILAFLQPIVKENTSPMCGNSICQDRRFMARYMPDLEKFFHYRNLDVSTLKELAKYWNSPIHDSVKKNKSNKHRALEDVRESITELKYYREHFLKIL